MLHRKSAALSHASDPTLAPIWSSGRGPLAVLPAALFRDRQPWLAIVVGWVLAAAGSVAIGFVLTRMVPGGAGPTLGKAPPLVIFLGLTLFSPIVETLLMAAIVAILLAFVRPWIAVLVSAIGWGVAHSLMAPLWGAVIWWPFLIFSTVFVTWRSHGFVKATALATAIHVLQNLAPAVLIAAGY